MFDLYNKEFTIKMLNSYLKRYHKYTNDFINLFSIGGDIKEKASMAYVLFHVKYNITFIIQNSNMSILDLSSYQLEYNNNSNKLDSFINLNKKGVCDVLLFELKELVTDFCSIVPAICKDPLDTPWNDEQLDNRDMIEIFLTILSHEFNVDVKELKNKIIESDAELWDCYYENIEKIVTYYSDPLYEITFYPKSYWWRHPTKILEDKQKAISGS